MATFFAEGQDNALTERSDDLFLNHKALGLLTTVNILNRLNARNISTVNVSGEVFIEQFLEECSLALNEGYNISTSLFRTTISIKGVIEASQLGRTISTDNVGKPIGTHYQHRQCGFERQFQQRQTACRVRQRRPNQHREESCIGRAAVAKDNEPYGEKSRHAQCFRHGAYRRFEHCGTRRQDGRNRSIFYRRE